ncbi:MAG: hypothetical protein HOP23_01220 [Methylococcaceae bacterium]|nr:hypothetical protein [Methylococcaceae bacterium]
MNEISKIFAKSALKLTQGRAKSKLIIHDSNLILFFEPTDTNQIDIFEENLYSEIFYEYLSQLNRCIDFGLRYIDSIVEVDENCYKLSCGEATWDKQNIIGIKVASIFNQLLEPKEAIRIFGEDRYQRVFCELNKLTKGEILKTDKTIHLHGFLNGIIPNEKQGVGYLLIEDKRVAFKYSDAKHEEALRKIIGNNLKCMFEFEVYKDLVGIQQKEVLILRRIINPD